MSEERNNVEVIPEFKMYITDLETERKSKEINVSDLIFNDYIEFEFGDYEDEDYGNYGARRPGYDSYGRENYGDNYGENYGRGNYGRRGYDSKYRGHEHLDRMYENYGRYEEGKERYGANSEETKRGLKYMLESMEDFARMLRDQAGSQEEVEMIRQTAQKIAQM